MEKWILRDRCVCGPEQIPSQVGNLLGASGRIDFQLIMFEAEMQSQVRDHLHGHTCTLSLSNWPQQCRLISHRHISNL